MTGRLAYNDCCPDMLEYMTHLRLEHTQEYLSTADRMIEEAAACRCEVVDIAGPSP